MRTRTVIILGAIVVTLVLGVFVGGPIAIDLLSGEREWTGKNIEAAQAAGDAIVLELRGFARRTGRYPADLGELERAVGRRFPLPKTGVAAWYYEPKLEGGAFNLTGR